jgi:hypothetical protein
MPRQWSQARWAEDRTRHLATATNWTWSHTRDTGNETAENSLSCPIFAQGENYRETRGNNAALHPVTNMCRPWAS